MTMTDFERDRHRRERGAIVRALKQVYSEPMTGVQSLRSVLRILGFALSPKALQFHLTFLAERGYIQIWRADQMPGYKDEPDSEGAWTPPDEIVFAHLLSSGLELLDREKVDLKVTV